MTGIIESKEVGSLTVNLWYDETCSTDPRKEFENFGTFFGFHPNYGSPDTPPDSDPQKARKIAESSDNVCMQVWLYDHSGTCYKATRVGNPFHCPWDSGLFGFIYVSKEDIRKEFGCKKVGPNIRKKVESILAAEVDTYSAWANGEVYGWEVVDAEGTRLDSCWGYIGEPEYAMKQGVEAAKGLQNV